MLRLFLLSFLVSVLAVVPLLSMVRKTHYSSTPVMISCTTCKEALHHMATSKSVAAFSSRVPHACQLATIDETERIGCVQTLYQHSELLFANQQRFIPSEASCYHVKATNCHPMTILCDRRKKKGYCHVITD
jgi:hypothetical protein